MIVFSMEIRPSSLNAREIGRFLVVIRVACLDAYEAWPSKVSLQSIQSGKYIVIVSLSAEAFYL